MSTAIQNAIDELETELAGIDDKRGDIEKALAVLQRLQVEGVTPNGRVSKRAHVMRSKGHARRVVRATKQDGRTDGARRGPARRSLPNDKGESILAALRKGGGSMRPGALAAALEVNLATLRYQLKPLLTDKLVVATGATAKRVISLPGKSARGHL